MKYPSVLSRTARAIVEQCRGHHPEAVIAYRGAQLTTPVTKGAAWRRARRKSGLAIRFHDLRHTAAQWWRDAGVPKWTVQALLGHKGADVTDLYATPTLRLLAEAVEAPGASRRGVVRRVS